MKIADVAIKWLEDKRIFIKESSVSTYEQVVNRYIIPQFGDMEKVSDQIAQDYVIDRLAAGVSRHTVRDRIVILRQILKFGAKHGMTEKCHDFEIRYPKNYERKKLPVMLPEHQSELMEYVKNNLKIKDFRLIGIYVCLTTGIRIGEVCGIKWEDIDFEQGVININKSVGRISKYGERHTKVIVGSTKSDSSYRDVPMTDSLRDILLPYKNIADADWFLLSMDKKPQEPRVYRNYFYRILDELDIPRVNPHGMRHSFATRCIDAGADVKTVSSILGHSDVSITLNIYVHPTMERKKSVVNNIFTAQT